MWYAKWTRDEDTQPDSKLDRLIGGLSAQPLGRKAMIIHNLARTAPMRADAAFAQLVLQTDHHP
jgi:hypothetical protein